jgi:hypothetical protein
MQNPLIKMKRKGERERERERKREREVVVVLGIRQQQHLRRGELGVPLTMLNNTNNHIIHI